MEQIQSVGHFIAIDKPLLQEWQKHRSNFSIQWLSYMQRRGKVKFVKAPTSKIKVFSKCVDSAETITEK